MVLSVLFHPTEVFKKVDSSPVLYSPWLVVIIAGIFLAIVGYYASASWLTGVYMFIANIVQWFILTLFVWFFGFIHLRKKRGIAEERFAECAAATGKLWTITLATNLIMAILSVFYGFVTIFPFNILAMIGVILAIILTIGWIVASYKMLKVVLGINGGKLFVNWILLLILNVVTSAFIVGLIAKIF
ncbi:Yip1 domain protein [uncultured archaeon]|nr:Yip1 domain protein [uncultured archaeon]